MADNENWVPGSFWIPGEEEHAVHGRLYLSSDFRLELEGFLSTPWESWTATDSDGNTREGGALKREEEPLLILGNLRQGRRKVSLFECITTKRSGNLILSAEAAQTVRPQYGLRGIHTTTPTDFTSARLRFQHLDRWASALGFGYEMYEDGKLRMSYDPPQSDKATLTDGATVSLDFITDFDIPDVSGGGIARRTFVRVEGFQPTGFLDVDRKYQTPLVSLLQLSLLHQSRPISLALRVGQGRWVDVLSEAYNDVDPSPTRIRDGRTILGLADIGLEGVAQWLDRVKILGPLPPVVADTAAASSIQLESMLVELTSVAEGLHSRLLADPDRPVNRETFERVRDVAVSALEGEEEEVVELVRSTLSNIRRVSYRSRLAALRGHVGAVVEEVFGYDVNAWEKIVTQTRNKFAHRDVDHIKPEDVGEFVAVVYSVRWLLVALLLAETGITHDSLRTCIKRSERFELFVAQAPSLLPEVYAPAAARS